MAEKLYLKLYEHYKSLILDGSLTSGERLPPVRRCCSLFGVSKTTVELAYQQLAAEGYVIARPQSGFYVTSLSPLAPHRPEILSEEVGQTFPCLFDLASTSVDRDGFNFTLWQRYLKSALRAEERLLSYGEPQGEYDLRLAVSHYAAESRSVVCSPSQIVIGAGVQSLLHILCALTNRREVFFVGEPFPQGQAIFHDHGYLCYQIGTDFDQIAPGSLIYVAPSHGTPLSPPMPVGRRTELLKLASHRNCLILEDDYDSEFSFYAKPVPSLQSLDGGERVAYIGTFSKLLLPSIRISFLVLPRKLRGRYAEVSSLYNQTASKAEQIALCSFIRDGGLSRQIRKVRKYYVTKNHAFSTFLRTELGSRLLSLREGSGVYLYLEVETKKSPAFLQDSARNQGIALRLPAALPGGLSLLLSCSTVPSSQLLEAARQFSVLF